MMSAMQITLPAEEVAARGDKLYRETIAGQLASAKGQVVARLTLTIKGEMPVAPAL